ncbi:MAG: hypothetical protein WAM78_09200 [Candidatus Sulfotelmatobacter sp.]
MSFLYLLGGRQRKLLFKNEDEQRLYEAALILRLDTSAQTVTVEVEYKSPPEACASDESSHVFKSATLVGNKLYTCTSTEVLIFEVPSFKRIGYISLPCFNDVHHVTPTPEGDLLVADTGLDMVVKFTPEGRVLAEWNVLGQDPWSRFSRDVDYRKVDSTKPHQSHPNSVFQLGEEVWVTRLSQKDAVCLTNPGSRINIDVQRPHDGLVDGDRIYFTTVDGRIVIANRHTLQIDQIVDLNEIHRSRQQDEVLLGWCRGVLPLDRRRVWVGFTRVRKTQFKENVMWIKHAFKEKERSTHIALYDIVERKCLQEIDLECFGMNVIFGIYPAELRAKG